MASPSPSHLPTLVFPTTAPVLIHQTEHTSQKLKPPRLDGLERPLFSNNDPMIQKLYHSHALLLESECLSVYLSLDLI
jgi:hypothetical protein